MKRRTGEEEAGGGGVRRNGSPLAEMGSSKRLLVYISNILRFFHLFYRNSLNIVSVLKLQCMNYIVQYFYFLIYNRPECIRHYNI